VTPPFALVLFGFLAAASSGAAPRPSGPDPALVLVALPPNADPAILEALNRLRGEAMSVGFEVRLVDTGADPRVLDRLEGALAGLRPAAVVTVARPDPGQEGRGTLDVTFIDQSSGKISVAHFTAVEVADVQERGDVIIAVRAVDFIRARMFDALAGRRVPPAPPPAPPPPPAPRVRRYHVAAGVAVLGTPSGFAPSVAPRLAVGYWLAEWLRLGIMAEGLGSEPGRRSEAGQVRLDQRFLGAAVTLASPSWHRGRLLLDMGGGEYWVTAHGDATAPYVGRAITLSSPGALASAGLAIALWPHVAVELRGGTLWLHSEAHVSATEDIYLGSLGSSRLGAMPVTKGRQEGTENQGWTELAET
jgi:hypothetical protein